MKAVAEASEVQRNAEFLLANNNVEIKKNFVRFVLIFFPDFKGVPKSLKKSGRCAMKSRNHTNKWRFRNIFTN